MGLEPIRPCGHQILSLKRLPFRHLSTLTITRTNLRKATQIAQNRAKTPTRLNVVAADIVVVGPAADIVAADTVVVESAAGRAVADTVVGTVAMAPAAVGTVVPGQVAAVSAAGTAVDIAVVAQVAEPL